MAVVKANAYGHGVEGIASALASCVEMFGVANVAEAERLRALAPRTPILILGTALRDEREAAVCGGFIAVVSSADEARSYAVAVAKTRGAENNVVARPFCVHLAVDTGMGRIGIWQDDAINTALEIARIPELRLAGVATHLPSADEDFDWTDAQLAGWSALVARMRAAGLEIPLVHSHNSAGVIHYGESARESNAMVRAGLMLYGSSPLPEFQEKLQPVLAWKSRIALLRNVPAGRSVSYGRTFVTPRPMRIATVPVGYGDGYQRHLSNKGAQVLIGGRRCAVLGRVTMDQILADATEIPDAQEGDEVTLVGKQGVEEITAAELAAKAGTIPWEIFTGIGTRVARRYIP